jgi:membrane associated rhomboid family serine protease
MLDDIKNIFRGNNFIGQIIIICAVVFVVQNLLANVFPAFGIEILRWFAMHSYLPSFLTSPWSAFTYMFLHGSFGHLFWNMIIFYYFGRIVHDFVGRERLMGLYFLGGIAGAIFYLLVYSLQHLGGEMIVDTPLVGASAGIMAVVTFAGFRFGDFQMNLLLIGPVKLKYVALGLFVMNTLLDISMNTGGKLSHLGGAAFGYFYFRSLNAGKDPAAAFLGFFQNIGSFFKKKPKMRVVENDFRAKNSNKPRNSKEAEARTDAILDKISKSGYDNLTNDEKEFLLTESNKK